MDSSSEDFDPTATYWVKTWEFRPMPWEVAVVSSVISAILGAVGTLTNGLVIYLIMRIKKIQELQNNDIPILSLCFSDFLSSVVLQPQLIARMLARDPVPEIQSVWTQMSSHFTLLAGSQSLLLITLNRYLSIRFPFHYTNYTNENKTYACIIAIYTASILMCVWVFVHGKTESQAFPVIVAVVFFFTIVLQITIFMIVKAQNRNMRRQIVAVEHNQVQRQNEGSNMVRQTNAQRSKANRTILYICAVFIATWLPCVTFRFYYVIHGNLTFYLEWLHMFTVVIQFHSCINPFIYVIRTSRVKNVLTRLFRAP